MIDTSLKWGATSDSKVYAIRFCSLKLLFLGATSHITGNDVLRNHPEVPRKPLKNKPLIEAIFELRWELQEPGMKPHTHHKIPISKMYNKTSDECPFHEPTATMSDPYAGEPH